MLTVYPGDLVGIKSGFASGYRGEGPRGLSRALCLLQAHAADIQEFVVSAGVLDRLDRSALTTSDLTALDKARAKVPQRWPRYISEEDAEREIAGTHWHHWCQPVMPFAILDSRVMDLATTFWQDPDARLLTAYRRLEDRVRERTGKAAHGSKLFSVAFRGDDSLLHWSGCDKGEQEGRASLFTGVYMAFRNRRAHRSVDLDPTAAISEFLLLNQLFLLEREAVHAPRR